MFLGVKSLLQPPLSGRSLQTCEGPKSALLVTSATHCKPCPMSDRPFPLPIPQHKYSTVPATIFCLAWMCSRQMHVLFLSAHPDFVTVTNAFSGWERLRGMLAKWLQGNRQLLRCPSAGDTPCPITHIGVQLLVMLLTMVMVLSGPAEDTSTPRLAPGLVRGSLLSAARLGKHFVAASGIFLMCPKRLRMVSVQL